MGVGRYFCVALPFILTVASIIAALIVGLTGVSSNDLYLFRIDLSNVTIDVAELQGLINNASALASGKALDDFNNDIQDKAQQTGEDIRNGANKIGDDVSSKVNDIVNRSPLDWHDPNALKASGEQVDGVTADDVNNILAGQNITAADIGLAKFYDFTLWGYCVTPQEGKRNCTKAQFDWASKELDLAWVKRLSDAAQLNVTLPKELEGGLDTYKTVTKWAEVVFIIALVALGLELIVGLFTACSRAVSCVTWVISGFATTAIIAFAALLTATGTVVIGVVIGASHHYGGKAHLNTSFLAVLWLSVAFALGASFFWLFSICCCKPENRPHARGIRHSDGEKLIPNGSYAPIGENRASAYSGYNYNAPHGAPQRGGARSDLAYEPYSHSRV